MGREAEGGSRRQSIGGFMVTRVRLAGAPNGRPARARPVAGGRGLVEGWSPCHPFTLFRCVPHLNPLHPSSIEGLLRWWLHLFGLAS